MPKLHLDTDIGGDIDDLCALAMVLTWPDVDLLAVTTNQDNSGRRAGYARYALRLAGRERDPRRSRRRCLARLLSHLPGLTRRSRLLAGADPAAPGPLDAALDLLEHSIEQGAIIAAIGAYTNLALLEKRSPGILRNADLVLMGGYVFPPRAGYPAWGNNFDWNVQNDIGSAQIVIERSNPILVPLTVTVETALRRSHLPALRQAGPLAQIIARQAEAFAIEYGNETQYGHTCAVTRRHHQLAARPVGLRHRVGLE